MNDLYKHIVIEGNIGSGKTTLSKLLADQLNAKLILEEFDNNPFLPMFYSNRSRYAFQVELFFLAERYHQLSKNLLGNIFQEHRVYDYHFSKSAIFSKINLEGDEQSLFGSLFQIMERFMLKPDIIIYLLHSIEKLRSQINQRGRGFEKQIPDSYLQSIHKQYLVAFREVSQFPVVILDMSTIEKPSPANVLETINQILSKDWKHGLSYFPS